MNTSMGLKAKSLLSVEKRTLELLANGVSLSELLNDLCQTIDEHVPGVISTVLLMGDDGKHLWPAAGPRFPAALMPAISPWEIGPDRAACGTAAFLKERVIISDVSVDPRWPDAYRTLAVNHDLRAAWSEPLISKDGAVLGTFAMYYAEPRIPETGDLELIELAGRIALIAIQLERSQIARQDSEERFRLVANTAPVMIWMSNVEMLCSYVNQPWLEFTGRSIEAELGSGWAEGVHPEDVSRCLEVFHHAFDRRDRFELEYRLRRRDGEYRWVLDHGVPRFGMDGSFLGYIGSCLDVTERKRAEQALSLMSQRLIEAQEQERSTIARELHDDINQRISLASMGLHALKQDIAASGAVLNRITEVMEQLAELGRDIQALSHRLHSPKLEQLGLEKAAASLCRELSNLHDLKIEFQSQGIPEEVPKEVALCLFRILQEALQNAIKHSGATDFQASLTGKRNNIHLTVRDSGKGFDTREALSKEGIGLASMKERLKSVNGALSIQTQPGIGTKISARVPVNPITKSAGSVSNC